MIFNCISVLSTPTLDTDTQSSIITPRGNALVSTRGHVGLEPENDITVEHKLI